MIEVDGILFCQWWFLVDIQIIPSRRMKKEEVYDVLSRVLKKVQKLKFQLFKKKMKKTVMFWPSRDIYGKIK